MSTGPILTRRRFLLWVAGTLGLPIAARLRAQEAPADAMIGYEEVDFATALRKVIGSRTAVDHEAVVLELPTLAGSGNSVELSVRVDPSHELAGKIRSIHIFAERNPRPHLLTASFPAGVYRPEFTTRIRLSGTQFVSAFVETDSGSLWRARREVTVTIGACDALQFRY